MIKKMLLAVAVLGAFAFTQAPSQAEAQTCLTSMFQSFPTNYTRHYKLVTHQRDNNYVLYQEGTLTRISAGSARSFVEYGLFSDRLGESAENFLTQPFDVEQRTRRQVTISSTGQLSIEN